MKNVRYIAEKLEQRRDETDSRIDEGFSKGIELLSDRSNIYRALIVLGICNLILWLSVLIFPSFVGSVWANVGRVSDKVAVALLGIPFGLGLYLTYSIFRLKFDDVEHQNVESTPLGSFNYQSQSQKRYLIWLFSVLGGVLNTVLMVLTDIFLTGG